jgi:hypothetical protein
MMIKRRMLFLLLVGVSSCEKSKPVHTLPSQPTVEAKVELDFGTGAHVLYYNRDDERMPGFEEWIVQAPSFDWKHQNPSIAVVKILDTTALEQMLTIRVPTMTTPGPNSSERATWKHISGARIVCDVLTTSASKFIHVTSNPK